MADDIDQLIAEVLRSAKYRAVSPAVVRRIGLHQLTIRRTLKEAIKETKNTLHQVYGAFAPAVPRYERWLEDLQATASVAGRPLLEQPSFRDRCLRIMSQHVSTAERLPYLPEFYRLILAEIPPVRSVLDIGCGLNPLALPWMGLAPDVHYRCCDIDAAATGFLNGFFELIDRRGTATVEDVAVASTTAPVDLAMLLKVLPVLDTQTRNAGNTLLRGLNATWLMVSFPARTLGGRNRGMVKHYEQQFITLATEERWPLQRFEFPTELVFLARKAPLPTPSTH